MALECVPGKSKVNPVPAGDSDEDTTGWKAAGNGVGEETLEAVGKCQDAWFSWEAGAGLDLQVILWATVITVRQTCWENDNFPKSCDFRKHFVHF